jgi:hypothetical protein
MEKKRKIAAVVKKVNFKEAEEADDEYWAKATVEERLAEMVQLRKMFFGGASLRIEKVVSKRSIYDED